MKIFFALALVMCFSCSAVLGIECGDTTSTACQTEFDNYRNNDDLAGFYTRCAEEGGDNPLRASCVLCCTECASGFTYTSYNLDGSTKSFSWPGEGIENCAAQCGTGCTGYEYNHGGEENYKCATYTGGTDSIMSNDQLSTWTSCILDSLA